MKKTAEETARALGGGSHVLAKLLEVKNFKRMKKQTNEQKKKCRLTSTSTACELEFPTSWGEKTPVRAGVAGEKNGAKISPVSPPIPR